MLQAEGGGVGPMVDGARLGPPPDLPSLILNNRIVYLGMPISASVAELLIGELLYLQYDSTTKPIQLYINSPGTTNDNGQPVGFETEAFSIADTMNYIQPPVHTLCVGRAYGLAAMLLANGEKGKRLALPYGTIMLHQPRGQMAQGQASDIAIKAREILLNRKVALEMMSESTGQSIEKLERDTSRCLYLSSAEAVEYGVVDRVIETLNKGETTAGAISEVSRGLG